MKCQQQKYYDTAEITQYTLIDLDLIKYWRDLGGSQLRRGLREEGEDELNDLEGKRRDAAALARVKDLT